MNNSILTRISLPFALSASNALFDDIGNYDENRNDNENNHLSFPTALSTDLVPLIDTELVSIRHTCDDFQNIFRNL